jgi:hypothetical protein
MRSDPTNIFEEFWQVYPRKVGKPLAIKAWNRAMKGSGHDKPLVGAAIVSGLWRWVHSREWLDRIFIPYPATFLNQRRWEDEPTPWRPRQKTGEAPEPSEYGVRPNPRVLERERERQALLRK